MMTAVRVCGCVAVRPLSDGGNNKDLSAGTMAGSGQRMTVRGM